MQCCCSTTLPVRLMPVRVCVVCAHVLQMLMVEFNDLYTATAKANYPAGGAADKPAAFDAFFAADGPAQKHLGHFNKVGTASLHH